MLPSSAWNLIILVMVSILRWIINFHLSELWDILKDSWISQIIVNSYMYIFQNYQWNQKIKCWKINYLILSHQTILNFYFLSCVFFLFIIQFLSFFLSEILKLFSLLLYGFSDYKPKGHRQDDRNWNMKCYILFPFFFLFCYF